jgi:deoxyribonuclease V
MIVALDVDYDEDQHKGTASAVVFEHWEDSVPLATYVADCSNVQPYVPGEFFKRELPCLLAVLATVKEPLTVAIVDSFVALGEFPGLGMRLWEALGKEIPVIGVAKTRFRSAICTELFRGSSKTPLYVTNVGIDSVEAVENVRKMHGSFRIPTLLTLADHIARSGTA